MQLSLPSRFDPFVKFCRSRFTTILIISFGFLVLISFFVGWMLARATYLRGEGRTKSEFEIRSELERTWLQMIKPFLIPDTHSEEHLPPLPKPGEPRLYLAVLLGSGEYFIKSYDPKTKESTILEDLGPVDITSRPLPSALPSKNFKYIAYVSRRDDEIHVADSKGKGDTRVSFGYQEPSWEMNGSEPRVLRWSSDGTKLLYEVVGIQICAIDCPRTPPTVDPPTLGYYLADFSAGVTWFLGAELPLFSLTPAGKLVLYLDTYDGSVDDHQGSKALFSYDLQSNELSMLSEGVLPLDYYHSHIDFENGKFVSINSRLREAEDRVVFGSLDGKEIKTVASGDWARYHSARFSPTGRYLAVWKKAERSVVGGILLSHLGDIIVYDSSSLEEVGVFAGYTFSYIGDDDLINWWDDRTIFAVHVEELEAGYLREYLLVNVEEGTVEKIHEEKVSEVR